MRPPLPPSEADQVMPPPKKFLREEQLDEIWEARGMKYRFDDLHVSLLSRGLLTSVDRPIFRSTILSILKSFLVEGDARVNPKKAAKPRFPKVF